MTADNGVQPRDYVSAIQMLLFLDPSRTDVVGANTVIEDTSATRRTYQTMVALALIAHKFYPNFQTEEGRAALRAEIANLTDKQNQEDDNR